MPRAQLTSQALRWPAAALVAAACTARPTAPLEILPEGATLYRIADELGFESLHFAVAAGPIAVDRLRTTFAAGALTVKTVEHHPVALSSRTIEGQIGPFHVLVPAAAEVDRVTVQAFLRGALVARGTSPVAQYEQRGAYRLPLRGCWFVSSGHDFGVEHRRWYSRAHFAWDFVRVDGDGHPAPPPGGLADHRAFGQPIYAMADGVVVAAEDRFADRPPGSPGPREASNFLLIDHGAHEHAKLAHLARGSLEVGAGDRVVRGQRLAKVGNSGMSDAPHLHLHFQLVRRDATGRITQEAPLPIALDGYRLTSNTGVGQRIARGRPRRGHFVCDDE